MKKLFVGSLSWNTDDESLRDFFSQFGTPASATVVTERDSGRSRGFGFVEFEDDAEAEAAIAGGDGQNLDGRTIAVNEARPRTEGDRPRRGGGGGGRGGFGGGNGGGYRPRSY
ncbi:MAG: RNA-binding protein [Propionibacteriaceae bacterium]|nr:RNA-binding protein [Propionibacteriaceae bacterium]